MYLSLAPTLSHILLLARGESPAGAAAVARAAMHHARRGAPRFGRAARRLSRGRQEHLSDGGHRSLQLSLSPDGCKRVYVHKR